MKIYRTNYKTIGVYEYKVIFFKEEQWFSRTIFNLIFDKKNPLSKLALEILH